MRTKKVNPLKLKKPKPKKTTPFYRDWIEVHNERKDTFDGRFEFENQLRDHILILHDLRNVIDLALENIAKIYLDVKKTVKKTVKNKAKRKKNEK